MARVKFVDVKFVDAVGRKKLDFRMKNALARVPRCSWCDGGSVSDRMDIETEEE